MSKQTCRNFLIGAGTFALFAGLGFAANHHAMNGTWQLAPQRSESPGPRVRFLRKYPVQPGCR